MLNALRGLVCVCLFAAFITELINYAPFTAKTKANDSDEKHETRAYAANGEEAALMGLGMKYNI